MENQDNRIKLLDATIQEQRKVLLKNQQAIENLFQIGKRHFHKVQTLQDEMENLKVDIHSLEDTTQIPRADGQSDSDFRKGVEEELNILKIDLKSLEDRTSEFDLSTTQIGQAELNRLNKTEKKLQETEIKQFSTTSQLTENLRDLENRVRSLEHTFENAEVLRRDIKKLDSELSHIRRVSNLSLIQYLSARRFMLSYAVVIAGIAALGAKSSLITLGKLFPRLPDSTVMSSTLLGILAFLFVLVLKRWSAMDLEDRESITLTRHIAPLFVVTLAAGGGFLWSFMTL